MVLGPFEKLYTAPAALRHTQPAGRTIAQACQALQQDVPTEELLTRGYAKNRIGFSNSSGVYRVRKFRILGLSGAKAWGFVC